MQLENKTLFILITFKAYWLTFDAIQTEFKFISLVSKYFSMMTYRSMPASNDDAIHPCAVCSFVF
jgi:hypothetical protein